ncbi:MAG: 4Fe-4S binding protein [Planctomycetota bacterium]
MRRPDLSTIRGVGSAARIAATRGARGIAATLFITAFLTLSASPLFAEQLDYERPVDAAPQPEDIGEDYVLPTVQHYQPRAQWREATDLGVLTAAMGLCAWLVLYRRSRTWLAVLSIGCLLYFGLYREGCVCPIGAIQNMTVALTDSRYAVSYFVIAIFFLPLVASVLFGRVFCGGVCPLGAIQDLVLLKPVQVPRRLDRVLGSLKWAYLILAIWFAAQPWAAEPEKTRDFIICRFDPFVGFFRFAGPMHMLLIGGGLLVLGMFVGRPYCRYLCPYGVLLSLLSRLSWRGVSVTPDKELDCGLCEEACPYGAIEEHRAVRSACLSCARCFKHCPRQHVLDGTIEPPDATATTGASATASAPVSPPPVTRQDGEGTS